MRKLLIATRSKGKSREIVSLLEGIPFEVINLNDTDSVPNDFEVEEVGATFEGNAIIKAMTLGNMTGLLTIAEDSGLCVDALSGRPGIFSARYAPGTDEDRSNKLLKELATIKEEERTARFMVVAALYDPLTKKIWLREGTQEGSITFELQGAGGFGYDPVFFVTELGKTAAEATLEEKNKVSHRGKAFTKIRDILLHDTF